MHCVCRAAVGGLDLREGESGTWLIVVASAAVEGQVDGTRRTCSNLKGSACRKPWNSSDRIDGIWKSFQPATSLARLQLEWRNRKRHRMGDIYLPLFIATITLKIWEVKDVVICHQIAPSHLNYTVMYWTYCNLSFCRQSTTKDPITTQCFNL
jgi:hypothetical protein